MRARGGAALEADLRRLKDLLLSMGARCERMLGTTLRALVEADADLAQAVFDDEKQNNADELHIDQLALELLALHQPLGRSLRFTMMAVKVVTDLERIGDETVNLAERAEELASLPSMPRLIGELGTMVRLTLHMLDDALEAFVHEDGTRARGVFAQDDAVDALYGRLQRETREQMKAAPELVETAVRIGTCAKYIERIADGATSIAEMVVFLASGEDVRHAGD